MEKIQCSSCGASSFSTKGKYFICDYCNTMYIKPRPVYNKYWIDTREVDTEAYWVPGGISGYTVEQD